MGLSADQIERIAQLAKLDLDPKEEHLYGQQLAQVVNYIDQLSRFSSVSDDVDAAERLHEALDRAEPREGVDWALDNAPQSLDRFFVVPQIKASESG